MKYICISDFPNPPGNPIVIADVDGRKQAPIAVKTINGKETQPHIHKGVIFSVGTASTFEDLAPGEKTLVAQLMVSKKIKEAKPEVIKAVDLEVAADKGRAERDAKAAKDLRGPTMAEIMDALPTLIAAAVSAAVKK